MRTPSGAGLRNVAGNAARRATSLRRCGGVSHAVPFRTSLATTMHARRIGGDAERLVPMSTATRHKLSFEGCSAVRIATHPCKLEVVPDPEVESVGGLARGRHGAVQCRCRRALVAHVSGGRVQGGALRQRIDI